MPGLDFQSFIAFKKHLRELLPEVASRHRAEALARGFGFKSNSSLKAALLKLGPEEKVSGIQSDIHSFCRYLEGIGYNQEAYRHVIMKAWDTLCANLEQREPIQFSCSTLGKGFRLGYIAYPVSLIEAGLTLDEACEKLVQGRMSQKEYTSTLWDLLERSPTFIQGWAQAAIEHLKAENYSEAEHFADKAIQIAEEAILPHVDDRIVWGHIGNRPYLRALHVKLLCLSQRGDREGFADIRSRMLWHNPDHTEIRNMEFGCVLDVTDVTRGPDFPVYSEILPPKNRHTYFSLSLHGQRIDCVMGFGGAYLTCDWQGYRRGVELKRAGIYERREAGCSSWFFAKWDSRQHKWDLPPCKEEEAFEVSLLLGIQFRPVSRGPFSHYTLSQSQAHKALMAWQRKHPKLTKKFTRRSDS